MEPNESIYNMYSKFITFVSELVSLDKKITNEKMVAMKKAKNLKALNFDEFIDSFIAN
ncbi:hypothetical protein NC653_003633 [Populus alba x Populus x berolinensis]|uniref:Uncharacterized protein n=1 Tax=Populus alba x Populus x berolinensis TaxID=444605 RepID=A0AAD6RS60_9ROSI|nr:hypothetical protein NC653_003633 [Populus alba x Populus x berolinensis]